MSENKINDGKITDGSFEVAVEKDSLSAHNGRRLTTFVVRYPRCIHSELMTHRAFSRNAESSRARPFEKQVLTVQEDPFIPIHWGIEEGGMQCNNALPLELVAFAEKLWLEARTEACYRAAALRDIGKSYAIATGNSEFEGIRLHKTMPNRMIEPWSWITVIITATEWNNFFRLRDHSDAEVHFQKLARMMRSAMDASEPVEREWHRPFVEDGLQLGVGRSDLETLRSKVSAGLTMNDVFTRVKLTANPIEYSYMTILIGLLRKQTTELSAEPEWDTLPFNLDYSQSYHVDSYMAHCDQLINQISTARCSRVSYLKQGKVPTVLEDMTQFQRLVQGSGFGHWSPHEHIGFASTDEHDLRAYSGNFRGWVQWRKTFSQENVEG